MMLRRLYSVPDVPTGAIFNPQRGYFSVVVPLARVNLITNPSFETNTTSWTNTGGTTSTLRDTTASYHGAYALSIIHNANGNSGVYYAVSLTADTIYAFSLKINDLNGSSGPLYNVPGNNYKISIANNSGTDLITRSFKSNGRWQWVWIVFKATSTATHRLTIVRTDARAGAFNIDGCQLEAISDGVLAPTTYIDGDQAGLLQNQFPAPYGWNGTPHASTSYRLITTRAGGYVVNLDRFKFKALAFAGLGLTAVANVATITAGSDGAQYQTTIAQSRQFAINGFFDSSTPFSLDQARAALYSAVGPDSASPRQPLTLLYQAFDGEEERSSIGRIIASYQSGLEQNAQIVPREDVQLTFQQWLPAILGGDSGAALTTQSSVSNANRILTRSADGVWSALSTGASSNDVLALAQGLDGKIYIGGRFADLGGVANTDGIGYWDPSDNAFHAMGTGVSSGTISVTAIAVAPNGDVYVGGSFSLMGGVANTVRIAKWNGSAWSALSAGLNGQVRALAFGPDGTLYVGGAFTNADGDANADSIAKWNGSAFSALGTGSVGAVNALAVGLDGALYAGGVFSTMGGVADTDSIAKWNGSAWSALSTGMNNDVNAIAIGRDGSVYAGGVFTTAGGISALRIAKWNGSAWSALGSGMDSVVWALAVRGDGALLAGGTFTTAGGIALPDGQALWNGSAWVALDVDLPGTASTTALLVTGNNIIYVGYDTAGTATAGGVTAITNPGTARAYPTVVITGPSSGTGRVYQILNVITGKLIYLNLTINAGETVTIRTSPHGATVISSFRGDTSSVVLPGSSPDVALEKGANSVSFFTTSSTIAALLRFAVGYQSVSDLVD